MRGFLVGSLTLVVLEVLLRPGSASKVSAGSGVLAQLFQRALSPNVAGLPNRAKPPATRSTSSSGGIALPTPGNIGTFLGEVGTPAAGAVTGGLKNIK